MKRAVADLSLDEKRALLSELLERKAHWEQGPRPAPSKLLSEFALSVTDLAAEARLDPTIAPRNECAGIPDDGTSASILLTGATGFLGAFLLDELLRNTVWTINCLVRCTDAEDGRRRIRENYRNYLPGEGYPEARVIPIPGDLSKPFLGLSVQDFDSLAGKIDVIYHNGAFINWLYAYGKLKPTNVLGTEEVLRLSCRLRTKPMHCVSTLAVFSLVGNSEAEVIGEAAPLDHGRILYGGYAQSKWVSEKLVTIARDRGLPVAIYRPGLITGDSRTGAWNTEDVLSKMMRSWVALGSVPEMDAATDMTPVDYVSRGIVYLSRSRQSLGKVFHLFNQTPVHLSSLVDGIRSLGFKLRQVPYDEWRPKMVNLTKGSSKNPLSSLAPFFNGGTVLTALTDLYRSPHLAAGNTLDSLGNVLSLQYATRSVSFDCQETLDALAGSGVVCPSVDRELLKKYFAYFAKKGLFRGARMTSGVKI